MSSNGKLSIAQAMNVYGGGGAERVTLSLARGLHEMGVPSIAIATKEAGPYAERETSGVEIVDLATGSDGMAGILKAAMKMRKLLKQRRIDLVHAHARGSLLATLFASIGLKNKPRLWMTWHIPDDVLIETGLRRKLVVWALRKCEIIWGDSQDIIDQLEAKEPSLQGKGRVFINAVPEQDITPAQANDQPVLLWMARVAPTKDPLILMRAAATLRDEGHKFKILLAGNSGDALAWYGKQADDLHRDLNLDGVVDMLGWVDGIDDLLTQANIGVQTSLFEGLSLTLLEQMMAGLAVVATDVGDTAVAVKDGDTGLLIQPEDEPALTDALRKVITDIDLRRRLSANAHASAMETFSMTAMSKRTYETATQ